MNSEARASLLEGWVSHINVQLFQKGEETDSSNNVFDGDKDNHNCKNRGDAIGREEEGQDADWIGEGQYYLNHFEYSWVVAFEKLKFSREE